MLRLLRLRDHKYLFGVIAVIEVLAFLDSKRFYYSSDIRFNSAPSLELDKNAACQFCSILFYVSWPLIIHLPSRVAYPNSSMVLKLIQSPYFNISKTIRRQGIEFENILKFKQKSSRILIFIASLETEDQLRLIVAEMNNVGSYG